MFKVWFRPRPVEEVMLLETENRQPTSACITLNAFLLDTLDHRILIDTGIGAFAGEGRAGLMANLNTIGLDGSAIDTVFITHIHPDHVGGLIDADDQPVFPKARMLVRSGERDYWHRDIPEGAPEVLKSKFRQRPWQ